MASVRGQDDSREEGEESDEEGNEITVDAGVFWRKLLVDVNSHDRTALYWRIQFSIGMTVSSPAS